MKKLESYLGLPFTMELTFDGTNFIASFPELNGCKGVGSTFEEAVTKAMELRKNMLQQALDKCSAMLNVA